MAQAHITLAANSKDLDRPFLVGPMHLSEACSEAALFPIEVQYNTITSSKLSITNVVQVRNLENLRGLQVE